VPSPGPSPPSECPLLAPFFPGRLSGWMRVLTVSRGYTTVAPTAPATPPTPRRWQGTAPG